MNQHLSETCLSFPMECTPGIVYLFLSAKFLSLEHNTVLNILHELNSKGTSLETGSHYASLAVLKFATETRVPLNSQRSCICWN